MMAEQQAGLQKVKFNDLNEALDFRHECPVCKASLIETKFGSTNINIVNHHPEYKFSIRNSSNSSNMMNVHHDGKTCTILNTEVIFGFKSIFHVPITMACSECSLYSQTMRLEINVKSNTYYIIAVYLTNKSLTLSKDEKLIIESFYLKNPGTLLKVGDSCYKVDFIDFDPEKRKELYERFSSIIPFI
jgi:hypothetical protein